MISPVEIFRDHWKTARSSGDANADYCTFATVSENGQVSTRTLVLREVTQDSFVVFVNNTSPKWQQVGHSNKIELLIFWPSLMQQYRVRGDIELMPKETIEQHWQQKPYDSKIVDNFYADHQPQSSVLGSRDVLLAGIDTLKCEYPREKDVRFPENAEGLLVKANYIESWHGSNADRLHERYLYRLTDGRWGRDVLVP